MKGKFILFAFILMLLCRADVFCQADGDTQTIKVNATVIGYSLFSRLTILIGNTEIYHFEDILIRAEQDAGELKSGTYLRFRYDHKSQTANLPKEMMEKKNLWEFTLVRNKECDESMKDLLFYELEGKTYPYMARTPWAEKEILSPEASVSCYTLNADGYKKL